MTFPHNNPQGTAGSEQPSHQPQQEYIITEEEIEYIENNSCCLQELYDDIRSREINGYFITRRDLEEYYDAVAHINGKAYADKMWARVEHDTHSRPHTSAPALYKTQTDDDGAVGKVAICLCEQCKVNGFLCTKSPRAITSPPAPAGMTADELWDYSNDLAEAAAKAAREKVIMLFDEIESGIKAYEKENEHQLVRDECRGVYIPTNTIRRLIAPRKESLQKQMEEKVL